MDACGVVAWVHAYQGRGTYQGGTQGRHRTGRPPLCRMPLCPYALMPLANRNHDLSEKLYLHTCLCLCILIESLYLAPHTGAPRCAFMPTLLGRVYVSHIAHPCRCIFPNPCVSISLYICIYIYFMYIICVPVCVDEGLAYLFNDGGLWLPRW